MRIIGIDPGYQRIGFAVLEQNANDFNLIHSECFTTDKEEGFTERVAKVAERYRFLIEKHKPEVCAIEDIFMHKNLKTAIKIASTRGALIYCSHQHHLTIEEYTPKEIKKALVGNGSADKLQVEKMLKLILKNIPEGKIDDEYDAIAVALAYGLIGKK